MARGRKSRADRAWEKKQEKQKRYKRAIQNRLNRAERLLQEVYEAEANVHRAPDLSYALTSRAREALASARYALMNVRNR